MTRPEAIQSKVFGALRHGPLELEEIALEIDEPQFTVHAFLKDLRRERLVQEETIGRPHPVWRLTANGETAAALSLQMRLA